MQIVERKHTMQQLINITLSFPRITFLLPLTHRQGAYVEHPERHKYIQGH